MNSGPRYFDTYRAAQAAATTLARSINRSVSVLRAGDGWEISPAGSPVEPTVSKPRENVLDSYARKLGLANLLLEEELGAAKKSIDDLTKSLKKQAKTITELSETPNDIQETLRQLSDKRTQLIGDTKTLKKEVSMLRAQAKDLKLDVSTLEEEKARIVNLIGFEKKQLTTLQNAVRAANAGLGHSTTPDTKEEGICPVCGGYGGARGGCYKCDGKGWL